MIAAEMITSEVINVMATQARGLICRALTRERADALELGRWLQEILPRWHCLTDLEFDLFPDSAVRFVILPIAPLMNP